MKRIWTFGLFCILLTVFFAGYTVVVQRRTAQLEVRAETEELAHFVATDMSRNLSGLRQLFLGLHNFLTLSPQEIEPHSSRVRNAIDRILDANPFVTALLVLDAEGQIVHWNGQGPLPDVRDRKYFNIHRENHVNGLFVSQPFLSRVNPDQQIFAVSEPFQKDGSLDHVIVAIIDLNYFRDNYAELHLRPGEMLMIVSPGGVLFRQAQPGFEDDADAQVMSIFNQYEKEWSDSSASVSAQLQHGISLVRIEGSSLAVLVAYDEEIALEGWRRDATVIAATGSAVSVVFFLLTLLATRFYWQQTVARQKLLKLATTDALTGLANRRLALDSADLEIKKARRQKLPLSFVLMDLDHFKKVNDEYGHETGDLVLRNVAGVLRQYCRETDVLSRFGGEEFLLILPGTGVSGARITAEKIRKTLAENIDNGASGCPRVTASFGIAAWREHETESREILRRADRALYQAKKGGRNCIRIAVEGR